MELPVCGRCEKYPTLCFDCPNGRRKRREAARQSVLAQKAPRRAREGRWFAATILAGAFVATSADWSPNSATQRYVGNRGKSGSARLALETTFMTQAV